MKLSALVCAILASSAAAFAPSTSERACTALNSVDRRAAFGQIAGAAAATASVVAFPPLAFADGAVSAATITKARAVYGDRIYALKKAVDSGNFEAVVDAKNAFVLFNSGAYPRATDKPKKKAAIEQTNAIFAAVKAGDKSKLKDAYSKYVASNEIKPLPVVDPKSGQGYSGEYDYKRGTKAGAVYVR